MYRRMGPKELEKIIEEIKKKKEKDDLPSDTENRAENASSDGIYTNSSAETGNTTDH